MNREIEVWFGDEKVKQAYDSLEIGIYEDKELYQFITRAIEDLKKDPFCGIQIPKKLIPKIYKTKYNVDNLWKYDLPNAWRLIYFVKGDSVKILSIILEWFGHKEYERWFNY